MDFSIIIPNYNGARFLKTCLPALLRSLASLRPRSENEVILVDNGSTDQSLDLALKLIPQIKTIKNKKNLGFAPAVNQGIKKATGDWLIILNNDLILDAFWFVNLRRALNIIQNQDPLDSKIATIFGQVLNKKGTRIESQGLEFFDRGKAINIGNGQKYSLTKNETSSPRLIWGASASAVAYHRPTLLKVGLFDSDFFAYEEDVDLSLRLHLLGYQTLYLPKAVSYHLGGGTSSKMGNLRARMDAKNWFFIILKNYSSQKIKKNLLPILIERARNFSGLCKQTIKIYRTKSIYYLPFSILTTYGQLLLKLPVMLKKRHVIQKQIAQNK